MIRELPCRRHLRQIGVWTPSVLMAVLPVREVRPLVLPALERQVGVEHPEASPGLAHLDRKRGVGRPIAQHVIDHAAELRAELQRRAAAHEIHSLHRLSRRRVVGLRIAVQIGDDVHAVLAHVHLYRLHRIQSAQADAVGREAAAGGLGDVRAGHAREELPRHVLRRVHGEAVELDAFGFLTGEDLGAANVGEAADNRARRRAVAGGDDHRLEHSGASGASGASGECVRSREYDVDGGRAAILHGHAQHARWQRIAPEGQDVGTGSHIRKRVATVGVGGLNAAGRRGRARPALKLIESHQHCGNGLTGGISHRSRYRSLRQWERRRLVVALGVHERWRGCQQDESQ